MSDPWGRPDGDICVYGIASHWGNIDKGAVDIGISKYVDVNDIGDASSGPRYEWLFSQASSVVEFCKNMLNMNTTVRACDW